MWISSFACIYRVQRSATLQETSLSVWRPSLGTVPVVRGVTVVCCLAGWCSGVERRAPLLSLFLEGHFGWCNVLDIVNLAASKTAVRESLRNIFSLFFFGIYARKWAFRNRVASGCSVLEGSCVLSPIILATTYIPTRGVKGSPFLCSWQPWFLQVFLMRAVLSRMRGGFI